MRLSAERLLPAVVAAAAAALTAAAFGLAGTGGRGLALTVRQAVPAGALVPRADLVRAPLGATALPAGDGPLYAAVALTPGRALAPGDLTSTPPARFASLGSGMVAENVTLPTDAVPAGTAKGQRVAVAGAPSDTAGAELLADSALVLGVAGLAVAPGEAPSDVVTLALPLPSALVVAQAARLGTVALLPWQVPAAEMRP